MNTLYIRQGRIFFFTIHYYPSLAYNSITLAIWRGDKLSRILGKNTIFNEHPVRPWELGWWVGGDEDCSQTGMSSGIYRYRQSILGYRAQVLQCVH